MILDCTDLGGSEMAKRFNCVRFESSNDKKFLILRSIISEKKHTDLSDVSIHLLRLVFLVLRRVFFVFHHFLFNITDGVTTSVGSDRWFPSVLSFF